MSQRPPEADFSPKVPPDATPAQCVTAWVDLMNACDQLLLAGLRHQIGAGGDLQAAYRQWYAQTMEEHDRMMLHLMEQFARPGGGNGR